MKGKKALKEWEPGERKYGCEEISAVELTGWVKVECYLDSQSKQT